MSTPPQGEGWRPGDPHGSGPPWQQGPWLHPPGPPPPTGNGVRWLLGAVAVLLVIAIAVGIAVIVLSRDEDSGPSASSTGTASDIASANDTGPVSVITDEPTCATFVGINNSLAALQRQGWGAQRKSLGPASEWTPEQRSRVEAVATGMRNAANQSVALAKQTPHRVVRELYEQFIANGRAYADRVRDYVPADDGLASANVNASSAIIGICNTITFGSSNRGLGVDPAASPSKIAVPQDPLKSTPFITEPTSTCSEWVSRLDKFNSETTAWADADPSVPGSEWTPERRTLEVETRPLLTAYANDAQAAGRESGNPAFEDFALSSALYLRAYLTVADYTGVDGWLSYTGFKFANLISGACRAAG